MKDIDTILYIDPMINEADEYNDRYYTDKVADPSYKGKGKYLNVDVDDPRLYSTMAFGRSMQSELNNMGPEYSGEVTDFGKWVVVKINHHDFVSGRTSSKTFLVVFKQKGNGIVLSTANKWRSISGYGQAINYIRSACQALRSSSNQKI